jgi:signal transduction histidine kinase/CheY-like chemotaxis protein
VDPRSPRISLADRLIPADLQQADPLALRRERLMARFLLVALPFPLLAALLDVVALRDGSALALAVRLAIHAISIGGMLATIPLLRAGRSQLVGQFGSLLAYAAVAGVIYASGGAQSPALVWMIAVPVIALMFVGPWAGLSWATLCTATIAAFYAASALGWPLPSGPAKHALEAGLSNLVLMLGLMLVMVRLYDRESERALIELSRIRDRAQQASRAKGEFLANTSHEIRTPLTAILGYADLLLDGADESIDRERQRDMLRTIRRNGEHLGRVLNDVLDFSRIEAGRLEIERRRVALAELLADVHDLMDVQASAKGLAFDLELRPDLPASITTDPTRLRQVLVNLVGNAIRFTERGCIQLIAARIPSAVVDGVVIEVRDTGSGMTDEQLTRIFEPFTQADASTTRTHGGTGLGLSIARNLVELMGGTLSVSSAPERGSGFCIELPTGEESPLAAEADLEAESVDLRIPAGTRVLVAEDGVDNQRLIRLLLERAGCVVELAANGDAALVRVEAAGRDGFDAVLMDIQMPIRDGYATTRELRRRGFAEPIIALTAHAMADERTRCLEAGCDAYLTKPIDRAALIASLVRHIGKPETPRS